MNYLYFFLVLNILFFGCSTKESEYEIYHVGALKKVMKENNMIAHIHLDTIKNKQNLYALGALEDLEGEVTIFNGTPFISKSKDGENVSIHKNFNHKAAFLVYTNVPKWREIIIPNNIAEKDSLEFFIYQTAKSHKIDISKPFPFLIEGKAERISWHVINWDINDSEHTHEKHVKSGAHGELTNQNISIFGVYSDKHHGVFTHHTTNLHMHVLTEDRKIAGHLDDLRLGENMILKLPK